MNYDSNYKHSRGGNTMKRYFEEVDQDFKKQEVEALLPLRGTEHSAGYDFATPVDLIIRPGGGKAFFWTDVKADMEVGEVLLLDIRSSMGIKHDLVITNTLPIIDKDYHNNPNNDGNIGISLRNHKPSFILEGFKEIIIGGIVTLVPLIKDMWEENTVYIKAGERVAQGIFIEFKESHNCNTDTKRVNGIGSTGN